MKLCELIPGQRAEVVSVNAGGAPAARLRALGIAAAYIFLVHKGVVMPLIKKDR